jgi:hypothetical protein
MKWPAALAALAALAIGAIASAHAAPGRVLMVKPQAQAQPNALIFADFNTALAAARPGDTIQLAPGSYIGPLRVPADRGGQRDAWLTIRGAPDHATRIIGPDGAEPAFEIAGARYVEVRGLRASHPGSGDCFAARAAAHVRFVGNIAADCGGGGIAVMQSDHVRIDGNVAVRNAFTSPWQNSGISIYQPQARDAAPGPHIVIINNIAAFNDNRSPAPGQPFATDGNGIIVDDGRNTQNGSTAGRYPHPILVVNNLAIGNGGSGIRVFLTDNVTVRANTTYWNDRTESPRQGERSELALMDCAKCAASANLLVVGPWRRDTAALFVMGDQSGAEIGGNVFAAAAPLQRWINSYKPTAVPAAAANTLANPRFARATLDARGDFTLIGWRGLAPRLGPVGADMRQLPPLAWIEAPP